MKGKVPEELKFESQELQEVILGAALLEKNAAEIVIKTMKSEYFIKENLKIIFESMCRLNIKNCPIDLYTLQSELKTKNQLEKAGGIAYLANLTQVISSPTHVQHYCLIIIQSYLKKESLKKFKEMTDNVLSGEDIFEETSNLRTHLDKIETFNFSEFNSSLNAELSEIFDEMLNKTVNLNSIKTGYKELDEVTYGIGEGEMYIIGASPGSGKTSFLYNLAAKFINQDLPKRVLFFSAEASKKDVVIRSLCLLAEVPFGNYKTNKISENDWQKLNKASEKLKENYLLIEDTSKLTPNKIKQTIKSCQAKGMPIDIIFLDYVQLMRSDIRHEARRIEMEYISQELKFMAKETKIPFVVLSQLSREHNNRQGRRPEMTDLKESSQLEQDAFVIGFLHNPYKNGEPTYADGTSTENIIEFIIRKNRPSGILTTFKFQFNPLYSKFEKII